MWVALGELLGKLLPQLPPRDRNYRTQDANELLVAVVPEQLQELRHWLGGARQRVAQRLPDQPVGASALGPPLELILLQLRDRSWLPRHAHHSSTLGTPIPTVMARRAAAHISKISRLVGDLVDASWSPTARMNFSRHRGGTLRALACTSSSCSSVRAAWPASPASLRCSSPTSRGRGHASSTSWSRKLVTYFHSRKWWWSTGGESSRSKTFSCQGFSPSLLWSSSASLLNSLSSSRPSSMSLVPRRNIRTLSASRTGRGARSIGRRRVP